MGRVLLRHAVVLRLLRGGVVLGGRLGRSRVLAGVLPSVLCGVLLGCVLGRGRVLAGVVRRGILLAGLTLLSWLVLLA
ncbi:hypothetical protein CGK93_15750 [Arthrobacter sp. YN]|nr:hypothetical protein CGK93_15750 [Arthrobacter sp. YN]